MEGIKAAADKRKREQTINYEKIAAKQMKREGKDFESKGRYMTEGFKNMLKQNQEFEEKDLEKEQWNQNHSVINKNDMTSFYRRMYNQEMTFGGPRGPIIDETKPGTIEIQLGLENSEEENALETSKTDEKVTNDVAVHENKEESGIPIPGIIKDRSRSASKERLKKAEQTQADGEDTEKPEKVEIPMSREEKIRLAKERQKQRAAAMSQNLPL